MKKGSVSIGSDFWVKQQAKLVGNLEPTKPKEAGFGWRKGEQVGSDFGEENQEEVVGSKLENHLPNF